MKRLAGLLALGLLGLVPIAVSSPAEAAGPTVTISDRTDLVHGQEILVQGRNWSTELFGVTAAVCADLVDDDRCEQIGFQRINANGAFGMQAVVDVYLDLFSTPPVDCRIETCWLVVQGFGAFPDPPPIVRTATFDPNGPDPTRRPVDVSPTDDLVDGSLLAVQGEGFTGGGIPRSVVMLPCRLPVVVQADCDGQSQREVRIARDGILDSTYRFDAVLGLDDGPWDCRTEPCGLLVMDGWWEEPSEDLSEAGLAELRFDPDAPLRPPPSGTVSPSTDLVDDQPVQVEAMGFDPDERIWIQQCVIPVDDGWDPDRCHANQRSRAYGTTDANGALSRRVGVFTTLIDWIDPFDCRVETCGMVLTQSSPYRRLVVPISFDPQAPELDPQVTVTPSTGLDDGQEVTVHGTGFRAWTRIQFFECPPGNYPGDTIGCDLRTRARHWTGAPDGGEPGESFSFTYRVRRELRSRDCAIRRCVLYALSVETIPDADEVRLRFG